MAERLDNIDGITELGDARIEELLSTALDAIADDMPLLTELAADDTALELPAGGAAPKGFTPYPATAHAASAPILVNVIVVAPGEATGVSSSAPVPSAPLTLFRCVCPHATPDAVFVASAACTTSFAVIVVIVADAVVPVAIPLAPFGASVGLDWFTLIRPTHNTALASVPEMVTDSVLLPMAGAPLSFWQIRQHSTRPVPPATFCACTNVQFAPP